MKKIFVEIFIPLIAALALLLFSQQPSAAQPLLAAGTATPPPTSQPTPTPQTTKPDRVTSYNLNSVWGSSSHDIFAVGESGTILHYDGNAWSPMDSGSHSFLTTVWGSSASDVFVDGWGGTILHYDGKAWSPMSSGTSNRLWGIWGSANNDVFVFGDGGTILHYDGKAWLPMETGVNNALTTGWGSSGKDVFVVGWGGTILRYDGRAWTPVNSGTNSDLWGIWGSSSSNIFVAGEKPNIILHYDGKAWSPMDSGTNKGIWGVWADSEREVFIVGELGTILHYDGSAWSMMDSGTDVQELTTVWGSSPNDVFAVGYSGTILHYDGQAWSDMSSGVLAVAPPPKPTPQPMVESIRETMTSQALAGNLLGDPAERTIYVVLPPSYAASDKRYPVVYVLPWGDGYPATNASGFKWAMNSLLRKGEIQEMIVVVPDGSNKLGASHFRSSPTIGDYETYLTQEVVNYIDTHYRTLPTQDSRGLAGCSNGGGPAMRLAFKYPNVFSVAAPTDGIYDESLEVWPTDIEAVQQLRELPQDIKDLKLDEMVAWYVQMAAGSAPDPDNPPFYSEMPVRIVNGRGEFVPEVVVKIVEQDAAHEARRYIEQPIRLQGILIRHALNDTDYSQSVHSFEQLLTDLGIEHEYVEVESNHGDIGWEAASLKYMSDKLVFTATTSSPPLTPTVTLDSALVSKIETAISQTMKIYQIPGVSIGIIKDGQVAYTKGFGLAEVDTDRLVTPETVFQLASNSKTVVVTAIMQLKEQGKIDLDAPVTTYLPYFQLADERYKEITIRQLLSHRSGLPYNTGPGYYWYDSDYQSPEFDEGSLERHVRNLTQLKLLNAPGSERGYYSDLGFEILGDVIAKVSGQSFEAYTQEHIFAPLGMQHTSFMVRDIPPELLAAPHVQQGSQTGVNSFFPYSRQHAPSSHLLSNVDDMNRFALAQLNHGQLGEVRILPAAAYEEMWGTTYGYNGTIPPETGYGLGWGIGELAGHRMIDHGGLDIGFHSEFLMAPDDGLSVIIMANRDYDSWDLQNQVMKWLIEAKESGG